MSEQHSKRNTAEKIDGSIGKVARKEQQLIGKLADYITNQARERTISASNVKIAAIVLFGAGGYFAIVALGTLKTGFYAEQAVGLFTQFALGLVIIAVGKAVWNASKQLEETASTARKSATSTHRTAATTANHSNQHTVAKPTNTSLAWLTYAISAGLAIYLVATPARSELTFLIQRDAALFVWGYALLCAGYAYYLIQGGKWRFTINNAPMSWIVFLINIAFIYFMFIYRGVS